MFQDFQEIVKQHDEVILIQYHPHIDKVEEALKEAGVKEEDMVVSYLGLSMPSPTDIVSMISRSKLFKDINPNCLYTEGVVSSGGVMYFNLTFDGFNAKDEEFEEDFKTFMEQYSAAQIRANSKLPGLCFGLSRDSIAKSLGTKLINIDNESFKTPKRPKDWWNYPEWGGTAPKK